MRFFVGLVLTLALGVIGCSEASGTGGSAGDGGSGGVGGNGGDGGAAGVGGEGGSARVSHTLTTYEGPPEGVKIGLGPVLPGVEACETDTGNCVTSDAEGKAQLMLPANQEVSYVVSMNGRIPWMAAEVTDAFAFLRPGYAMWLDEEVETFAEANTIPYPLTGGVVLLHMNPTTTEGVTYTLIDDGGALTYYADEDGYFSFDLTATTVNGFGGFFEVAPGERQIEFGGAATNCTAALGWPGDAPNRVKVPVRVGHVTLASMNCDVQ